MEWLLRAWAMVALVFGCLIGSAAATDRTPVASGKSSASKSVAVIPQVILAQARRLGLSSDEISLQGDRWVGCRAGDLSSCIVLGVASSQKDSQLTAPVIPVTMSDVLEVHQYGKAVQHLPVRSLSEENVWGKLVTTQPKHSSTGALAFQLHPSVQAKVWVSSNPMQAIDTLPRFERESDKLVRTKDSGLVREYLDSHPSESIMVVVSVPSLCAPCRQMDQVLRETLAPRQPVSQGAPGIKTFILEYFTFADAEREFLGKGAIFPTTLVFEPRTQPRQSIARVIGDLHGMPLDEVARPLRQRLARGAPHTLTRGLLSRDLLMSLRQP